MSARRTIAAPNWTEAENDELVRAYNSRVSFSATAQRLMRTRKAVQCKTNELRKARPELFVRNPSPGVPDSWGVTTNDPGHIAAVLGAGGFGKLAFKPRPQRLFVWRAA